MYEPSVLISTCIYTGFTANVILVQYSLCAFVFSGLKLLLKSIFLKIPDAHLSRINQCSFVSLQLWML